MSQAGQEKPGALDTRPLDGIRAILNLWIQVFHTLFMLMYFLPQSDAVALFSRHPLVEHGYLAVDGFFVLTGYLIALPLLRAAAKNAEAGVEKGSTVQSLRKYYNSRFWRIVPPLVALTVLHCRVVNTCGSFRMGLLRLEPVKKAYERFFPGQPTWAPNGCDTAWASLVHFSMFMPYNGTHIHSWSVAVQYHAYLWLPWLWKKMRLERPRRMLVFVALSCAVAAASRFVAQRQQSGFAEGGVIAGALELFNYSNTINRIHVIVIGMLAAHVSHDGSLVVWLRTRKFLGAALQLLMYALVVAYFMVNLNWKAWVGDYRYEASALHSIFITLMSVGSPLSGLVWSWLIVAAVHRLGMWKTTGISDALTSRPLRVVADLSYWAYLLHPLVFQAFFSSPWLLYPPTAMDDAPWSFITGTARVPRTNEIFVLSEALAAVPATTMQGVLLSYASPWLERWFELRDAVFPHGHALSIWHVYAYALVGSSATYALSFVMLHAFEDPVRRLAATLAKRTRWLDSLVYAYNIVIMAFGPIIHVAATLALYWIATPSMEDAVQQMLRPANETLYHTTVTTALPPQA